MSDFYILYINFSINRNYLEKYKLPITDQWHIYGREGESYPFCISRNLEKLEEIGELMKRFNISGISIMIGLVIDNIHIIEDNNIIYNNFYFESCLNNCSFVPLDIAKIMFEEHVNDKYKMMNTFDSFYPTIEMEDDEDN